MVVSSQIMLDFWRYTRVLEIFKTSGSNTLLEVFNMSGTFGRIEEIEEISSRQADRANVRGQALLKRESPAPCKLFGRFFRICRRSTDFTFSFRKSQIHNAIGRPFSGSYPGLKTGAGPHSSYQGLSLSTARL
jgi:hypothetical protein